MVHLFRSIVLAFFIFTLFCEMPSNPFEPSKTSITAVFKNERSHIYANSITDTVGKPLKIGAAIFLPENFDSITLKIKELGSVIADTLFTSFNEVSGRDTAWFTCTFTTPGVKEILLTPFSTPALTPLSVMINIVEDPKKHDSIPVKIYFDKNDPEAHGVMAEIAAKNGEKITLPVNGFTRNRYQFSGWATSTTGDVVYGDKEVYTSDNTDDTLFAVWLKNASYSITFDKNDPEASGVMNTQSIVMGDTTPLNTNQFTKTGWKFAGWAATSKGPIEYTDNADFYMGSGNVMLYAVWTQNPVHKLVFVNNGGNGTMPDQLMVSDLSIPLNENAFTRTGWTFAGWAFTATGAVAYSDKSTFTMGTSDVALYAVWSQKAAFKVIFNSNGGTGTMDAQSIVSELSSPLTENKFTKSGSTFAGWASTSAGTVAYSDKSTYMMGTADVTLYAVWSQKPAFKVIFNSNGGIGIMDAQSIVSELSAPLTENKFTRTGWTFTGWASTATGTVAYSDKSTYMMGTADVTLYAVWSQKAAFKVTFNGNGGTGTMDAQSIVSEMAAPLTENKFTRTGWTFAGWASTATGTVAYSDKSTFTMGTADVALYAVWSQKPAFKVIFNSNGGTGTMDAQSIVSELNASLTENKFTRTGWTFDGWASTAAGTVAYSDKSTYMMGTADVTLYAVWSQKPAFKLIFNSNGGTGTMDAQSIVSELNALLNENKFTRTGWTFAGWSTTAAGMVLYSDKSTFTMGTADVTLYAVWSINKYTVTFNVQGGTDVSAQIIEYDGLVTAPAAPVREGYTFGGWYKEATCTNLWNFSTGHVAAAVTLFAKWTVNDYTVTFNDQNATTRVSPGTKTVTFPAKTTGNLPAAPVKTGYIFGGWNTASDGSGSDFTELTTIAGNITVYAIWKSYTYTVTFNGQNVVADQTSNVSSPAVMVGTLPAPSAAGYRFEGWFTGINGTGLPFLATTTVTENSTVYAKWVRVYKVTYDANGGSGDVPVDGNNYQSGTIVPILSGSSISKPNYTFAGWNTQADTLGTNFTSGGTFLMVSTDIVLYAKWHVAAPTIVTPFVNKNCPVNDSVTFTVVANGLNLNYRWQLNGVDIPNALSSSYTTSRLTKGDICMPRNYNCIITNSIGTSSASTNCSATLSVSAVNDIDGNTYHEIRIRENIWMLEDLKTTRYRDGSPITDATDTPDSDAWKAQPGSEGAYYAFQVYSTLNIYYWWYNWAAAKSDKIAPAGWRLPTRDEYIDLWDLSTPGSILITEDEGTNATSLSLSANGYISTYEFGTSVSVSGINLWAADQYHFEANGGGAQVVSPSSTDPSSKYGFAIRCIKEE
jgi:uncharacterized protein (TIGR02145 family)/uncharacterized repeat protein (TIGR02543 family)